MISTRDLSSLPDIDTLKRLMQSMAMLDAILCPEWEYRFHSFNSQWAPGEQMASMRNGCGDDLFALFHSAGCFLKGFAHEAAMSPWKSDPPQVWPGVLTSVPPEFSECLTEPAFKMEATTFCIWRRYSDEHWCRGQISFPPDGDPDGSAFLLAHLRLSPESYREWAEDYYEQPVDLSAIRSIYAHRPLSADVITSLNPALTLADLREDAHEIGYPMVDSM